MYQKNYMSFKELINPLGGDYLSFIDLKRMCILLLDSDTQESDTLLRIPTIDELYPYREAMHAFLYERKLAVPRGMSARKFVIANDLYYDFTEMREKQAAKQLEKWFLDNHIAIA